MSQLPVSQDELQLALPAQRREQVPAPHELSQLARPMQLSAHLPP
jgi:hypothetical protein